MDTRRIIEELDAIALRVANLKQAIVGVPQADETAESKVARGVCTYCGKPIGKKATQRGAHSNCYRTAKRRIEQHKTTDEQLVAKGLLLAPGTPGPKIDPNDPVIRDIATANEIAAEVTQRAAKKRKSE